MSTPDLSDLGYETVETMSDERRVFGYVARCGECRQMAGVVSARPDFRHATASFLATMVLDGCEIIACADREEYEAVIEPVGTCTCDPLRVYHAEDDEAESCPQCNRSVWGLKKRNTCVHCGTRWTAEKVLVLCRVERFEPETPGGIHP